MMRRHLMPLAAFLMQADPPALALGVVVLDAHGDDRTDAGEGEGHHGNQRPVTQAVDVSMLSRSSRACSPVSTVVLPAMTRDQRCPVLFVRPEKSTRPS